MITSPVEFILVVAVVILLLYIGVPIWFVILLFVLALVGVFRGYF